MMTQQSRHSPIANFAKRPLFGRHTSFGIRRLPLFTIETLPGLAREILTSTTLQIFFARSNSYVYPPLHVVQPPSVETPPFAPTAQTTPWTNHTNATTAQTPLATAKTKAYNAYNARNATGYDWERFTELADKK
jgi:hypothetical protein